MAKTDTRQVQLHRKVHERLVKERDRRNSEGWSDTLSDVVHHGLLRLEERRPPPRLNDLNIEILKGELLGAGLPPRRVEEAVGTLGEARDFYRRGLDAGPDESHQPDHNDPPDPYDYPDHDDPLDEDDQPDPLDVPDYDFPGDRERIVEDEDRERIVEMNRRAKDRLLTKGLARTGA